MKSNQIDRKIQIIVTLLLGVVMVFAITGKAQAVELVKDSNIPAGQTINDDVYITGDKVVIDGDVNGNLLAFGNSVTVNGHVTGDLITAGNLIIVNGKVSGNIFAGARYIMMNGEATGSVFGGSFAIVFAAKSKVERNIYYGGYSLETQKGAVVQRDLLMGGYQALLNGEVGRDARVALGALELNGKIGRNLLADVAPPGQQSFNPYQFMPQQPGEPNIPATLPTGMRIGPEASIGGKLVYTSTMEQSGTIQSTPAGGLVFQTPVPSETTTTRPVEKPGIIFAKGILGRIFKFVREIIALLVFGALAIWLVFPQFKRAADQIGEKPLPSLGVGFLALVAGYAGLFMAIGVLLAVAVLFAIITLGGISGTLFSVGFATLGLIGALFQFLVSFGSKLVFALFVGQRLLRAPEGKYGALALGVLIYALVHAIPILGWLAAFVVTLLGLGAIWYAIQSYRKPAVAVIEAPMQ